MVIVVFMFVYFRILVFFVFLDKGGIESVWVLVLLIRLYRNIENMFVLFKGFIVVDL